MKLFFCFIFQFSEHIMKVFILFFFVFLFCIFLSFTFYARKSVLHGWSTQKSTKMCTHTHTEIWHNEIVFASTDCFSYRSTKKQHTKTKHSNGNATLTELEIIICWITHSSEITNEWSTIEKIQFPAYPLSVSLSHAKCFFIKQNTKTETYEKVIERFGDIGCINGSQTLYHSRPIVSILRTAHHFAKLSCSHWCNVLVSWLCPWIQIRSRLWYSLLK